MLEPNPQVSAILVVDDDEPALRYSVRALQVAGFACDGASGVREAQVALGRADYDLMLTDLNLADGTGTELLRWAAEHKKNLPVMLMTGFPTVSSAVEALRFDAIDYLTKPCEQLGATVKAALSRARERNSDRRNLRHATSTLRQLADELERCSGIHDEASAGTSSREGRLRHPAWEMLSPREREISELLVAGQSVGAIAERLGITGNTVRNHLKASYRKFNVRSQVDLIRKILGG